MAKGWKVEYRASENKAEEVIKADKCGLQNGFLLFLDESIVGGADGTVHVKTVAMVNPETIRIVQPAEIDEPKILA